MLKHLALMIVAASLAACATPGGDARPGNPPVSTAVVDAALDTGAVVADATLPSPAEMSPGAATLVDDAAIAVAWESLDLAASAADVALAFRPAIAGTPGARKVADGLEGAERWLTIAGQAQRAQQASSYAAALAQARAAIAGVRREIATWKGN